jgi:hypothetical protein
MTKDQIIQEIKRTAKENDGKPLGRQRFLQATGIKESDWIGKFWTKWSDATKEAGFCENKMQSAYSDDWLLECYANLFCELGHIPTSPEIRMKARSDADFPSHNTFSRLGSKPQLLKKLLAFCQGNKKYNSLVDTIEKSHSLAADEEDLPATATREEGYVYLLQFGNEYKIGSSNNVERRFREIKTQMPYEGKIIHTITTGDPVGIEYYWHNHFKDKRLKGEWFKLSASDLSYFKKRKLM